MLKETVIEHINSQVLAPIFIEEIEANPDYQNFFYGVDIRNKFKEISSIGKSLNEFVEKIKEFRDDRLEEKKRKALKEEIPEENTQAAKGTRFEKNPPTSKEVSDMRLILKKTETNDRSAPVLTVSKALDNAHTLFQPVKAKRASQLFLQNLIGINQLPHFLFHIGYIMSEQEISSRAYSIKRGELDKQIDQKFMELIEEIKTFIEGHRKLLQECFQEDNLRIEKEELEFVNVDSTKEIKIFLADIQKKYEEKAEALNQQLKDKQTKVLADLKDTEEINSISIGLSGKTNLKNAVYLINPQAKIAEKLFIPYIQKFECELLFKPEEVECAK